MIMYLVMLMNKLKFEDVDIGDGMMRKLGYNNGGKIVHE